MTPTAESTLRHRAYFEALDEIGDDAEPDFQAVAAGLYALRLFDTWIRDECGSSAPDARQLEGTRRAITLAPPSATMRVLSTVVETIATARGLEGSMVLPALLAYARALHFEARWALAQDVYDTIISVSACVSDDELLLSAMHMRGYTLRMQGRLDEAALAYKQLRIAAEFVGETQFVLEGRLSEAKLAIDRGNLPQAEERLERLLAEPEVAVRSALRSKVLHDRSIVAMRRGELERAAVLGYEALALCKDGASRDRILSDIANTLSALGQWDGARDAFMIIAATAEEQHIRWLATINLMELAFLERRETIFDQYRRELSEAALPPSLAALYLQFAGQGLRVFGHAVAARDVLERAHVVAREHDMNELLFKIDALLDEQASALPESVLPAYDRVEPNMAEDVAAVVVGLGRILETVTLRT